MRKWFAILLLFLSIRAFAGSTTDSILKGWDTTIVRLANSAKNISYMTDDEKQVIFYINLCRMQPRLFSKTFLKQYLTENPDKETNSYVVSLLKDLKGSKPRHPLQPDADLYKSAEKWATETGKSGATGHGDFNKRFKSFLKKNNVAVGENCDYGNSDPLAIVLDLLIDEGIEDVGHRRNMLAATFNTIGVSIKPHKGYDWDCVMDFEGPYLNK